MRFAAFIMTYEREAILEETISKIFNQTLPPEEILIVDNSSSDKTRLLIESLNDKISYHNMGCNAGPAGAAHYGLKTLAEKGYDWIFWGDDDDPPKNNNIFKDLLSIAKLEDNVGIIGGLGGKFIGNRARTRNFYNRELDGIVEADYVAGGQMLIVKSEVIKAGILPTKKLFFGFEELDFCLKVKAKGYKIIFDGERIKNERIQRGDSSANYKWQGRSFGNPDNVWRDYYSIRNMLYILKERGYWTGYFFFLTKNVVKIPVSFKYGFKFGKKLTKVYLMAFWHHLNNKYGFVSKNNF